MQVLGQVVVLFLLMMCGLAAVKGKVIPEGGIQGLNKLVMYFALPCLTFVKLQQEASPDLMVALVQVFWMGGAAVLLCGGISWLLFRKETAKRRAVFTGMTMFSNAGFMGYPVLTAAFGEANLIYGIIYVAVFNLLNWTVGVMLFDRDSVKLKKLCVNPSLIAVVLGMICFVGKIRLPGIFTDAMNMMGSTTTPLAMFVIGARLSQLKKADIRDTRLLAACGLKLIVYPLLVYFGAGLLNAAPMVRATLTLCTAMPGAAVVAIQAEHYHGDGALASRGIALSTALSIATIPLIMLLF